MEIRIEIKFNSEKSNPTAYFWTGNHPLVLFSTLWKNIDHEEIF